MANSMDIADYVVEKSNEMGNTLSNLKLQKIIYFLNAIHLISFNKPLITDENFERWSYGPVLRSVYYEYSQFGARGIRTPLNHVVSFSIENGSINSKKFEKEDIPLEDREFIDKNLSKFLQYDPFDLVYKSHMETQWKNKNPNELYSDEKTIEYYSNPNNRFWEKETA